VPWLLASIATSHSSRAHASRRHHSPEVRQGPAAPTTFPYTLRFLSQALISLGQPPSACTRARNGGRKTRKPSTDLEFGIWNFRSLISDFKFSISNFRSPFTAGSLLFALCSLL